MLEIYNERVKDLLVKGKQSSEGLKIRQNPQAGFYVDGLKVRHGIDGWETDSLDIRLKYVHLFHFGECFSFVAK